MLGWVFFFFPPHIFPASCLLSSLNLWVGVWQYEKILSYYCFKCFFCLFISLSVFWYSYYIYVTLLYFSHSPWILGLFVCFFSVFDLPAFQFWRFLLRHPQILSSAVSSLLISSSKTFFISVPMFLIYRISCWFFLKFLSLCYLTLLCLHCLLYLSETLAF